MFVSDWSILLKFGLRRVYLVQIIHSLSFLRLIHSSSSLEIIHFFIPYVGSSENDAWVLTGWSKKKQNSGFKNAISDTLMGIFVLFDNNLAFTNVQH